MAYEPQQIQPGESLTFSIQPEASLSALQLESGATVAPLSVDQEEFFEIIGVAETTENLPKPVQDDNDFAPEPEYQDDTTARFLVYMCFGLCCCLVIIVVVVVTILVVRKRRK